MISLSTLYPHHPIGSRVLLRIGENELTGWDRLMVAGSSIFIVGSAMWVPVCLIWAWKRWRTIPKEDRKRRTYYAAIITSLCTLIYIGGPHRSVRVGQWLQFKKWNLWRSWVRYIALEIIEDQPNLENSKPSMDVRTEQVILALMPHGIFPFSLALAVVPDMARFVFGPFRPVVATATRFFPFVRDFLCWLDAVDASKSCVDRSLANGDRIGVVPGGIAEIFESYPKNNTHPNEEYAIVRKGILRMAIKYGIPIVPVYCFAATKMLRRLHIPLLERISVLLRIGICVFYGVGGLPIPFRQKLLYVMGSPIQPPPVDCGLHNVDQQIDVMHKKFCEEIVRLFERHKDTYGWSHKTLKLLSR